MAPEDCDLLKLVAGQFPSILELSYSECPQETVQDFVKVAKRAGELSIQGMVVYMDGMFVSSSLGLDLARALRGVTSLTTLVVCLRCVVDTGFVVSFLCGPFRREQPRQEPQLERAFQLHREPDPGSAPVREADVRWRVACGSAQPCVWSTSTTTTAWPTCCPAVPDIFHKLEVRKSNLDSAGARLTEKLSQCRHLSTLVLEHCHVLASTLESVLQQLSALHNRLVLRTLCLNLLSSARHFTRSDAKKPGFRTSLSLACCCSLAQFIRGPTTLAELTLCHDAITKITQLVVTSDVRGSMLVEKKHSLW